MVQLRQDYPEFTKQNSEILAINPDDALKVSDFWQKESMPFPGISDPDHRVGDIYGQVDSPATMGRAPAVFIVDKKGFLRYEHRGNHSADIPQNAYLLYTLDQFNIEK